MKPLQRFFTVAIIFILFLFVIDYGVGLVLDHYFFNLPESANECGKVHSRFCMEKDVVLMGSSRCNHHFVSSKLLDSIRIYHQEWTIYNYGLNGFFLNSSLCAVESMLNRYTPKVVIIEVDPHDFLEGERSAKGISAYAPFYDKDSIVRKYIDNLQKQNIFLYQSHLVRYRNAYPIKIIRTLGMKEDQKLGYTPLYGSKIDNEKDVNLDTFEPEEKQMPISQFTLQNFSQVSQLCKKKQVLMILVTTPRYKSKKDTEMIRNLCKKEGLLYLDYYNIFDMHPEWFRDSSHLNDEGANILTSMLFRDMKPFLVKNN